MELVQADGAFQRGPPQLKPLDGGVNESGKTVDDLGVKTTRSPVAESDRESEVEPASHSALRALASVDGKEAQNDEDEDQDGHDDGHVLVELKPGKRVGGRRRGRSGELPGGREGEEKEGKAAEAMVLTESGEWEDGRRASVAVD